MGIRISKTKASNRLAAAVEWARSERPVPDEWAELAERMDVASSKTYTPALGTALLARATDPTVDALAIKEGYSQNAYSQRTLCHSVLVPAAVEYGFTLRNTGREPLNNQPFFRYDHMDLIERVKGSALFSLNELRDALRRLNALNSQDALAALAAFLRVRFTAAADALHLELPDMTVPLDHLVAVVDQYLDEDIDRPRRTQALGAASLDLIYEKVLTRKLNDPSRDFPGDVQAFVAEKPIMSAEVRAKLVPATEVRSYIAALRQADISRAFIIVIHPSHKALDRDSLTSWAWSEHHVVLTIIESAMELLWAVCAWSSAPVEKVLSGFPILAARRLEQIEASPLSRERWHEFFSTGPT